MTLPLEGLQVLDFSRLLPGPFCSMMLGDMGADILRVEEPAQGSGRRAQQRQGAPERSFSHQEQVRRAAYDAAGRNKKSIILNLKEPLAREVVYRLAPRTDVVLEEFRPGVGRRLGVDYETLTRINPRIVYCSISLYGQNGPYRDLPGHDPCARAISGLLDAARYPNGTPIYINVPIIDMTAAFHAVIGILLALQARDRTGKGQWVDISMTDAALDFMYLSSRVYFRDGNMVDRYGWAGVAAGVWATRDGKFICTTNVEPHHWANFCRAVGREDLIPQQLAKGEKAQQIAQELRGLFQTRTREEWFRLAREVDTQIAPVLELEEVWDDPQIRAREMVLEMAHPLLGTVRQLGVSIKLSDTPGKVRSFAPLVGQHTQEVMLALGYTPEEIARLEEAGAIGRFKDEG